MRPLCSWGLLAHAFPAQYPHLYQANAYINFRLALPWADGGPSELSG
jgi:hypothetical protein